jgi:hypothetical protein
MKLSQITNHQLRRTSNGRLPLRAGAFTVEFAIVASIFFTTLLASFEFSRLYFVRHCVDQATYEAARIGIVQGATPAQVDARARSLLAAAGIKPQSVNIAPAHFDELTETVSVTIVCDMTNNSWIPGRFFVGPLVTSKTTLDHENMSYLSRQDSGESVGDNDNEPIDI